MRVVAACATVVLLVAGCGGGSRSHRTPAPAGGVQLTLNLKSGTAARGKECGAPHHFTRYRSGSRIEFAGTVRPVPAGRWKVKLKIKRCGSSGAPVVAKVEATRDKHSGTYGGTLPKLGPGAYFARASLYVDGRKRARSDKRHFSLR